MYNITIRAFLLLIGCSLSSAGRFWDLAIKSSTFNLTLSDLCQTFGASNLNKISPDISCDESSPCDVDTAIPGVSCSSTGNSTGINIVDFTSSGFSGFLPSIFINLGSLQHLKLSNNHYSGTIPASISRDLSSLQSLDLSQNSLTGPIPSSLCSLSGLTSIKVVGNFLSCYDSCFASKPSLNTDFVGAGLQQCSKLISKNPLSKFLKNQFQTCSYTQNPSPSSTWDDYDYCAFYNQQTTCSTTSIHDYECSPSCLLQSPTTFCQAFSLLSYGCAAEQGKTMYDVAVLAGGCESNFLLTSPTITSISFRFTFNITSIDAALLKSDITFNSLALQDDENLIVFALSGVTGVTIVGITIDRISAFVLDGDLGTAVISGFVSTNTESVGGNSNNADYIAQQVLSRIRSAFTTSNSSTIPFIEALFSQAKDTTSDAQTLRLTSFRSFYGFGGISIGRRSLAETAFINIGETFVTNQTSVTGLVLGEPIVVFALTATPTAAPIVSPPTSSPVSTNSTAGGGDGGGAGGGGHGDGAESLCVDLEVIDLFGDGWDSGKLIIYYSDGRHPKFGPSCSQNPLYTSVCFTPDANKNGDYIVIKVTGFSPDKPWEIYWRATNSYTGKTYVGDYNTAIIFTYKEDADHVPSMEMTHGEYLLQDDSLECDECTNVYNPDYATDSTFLSPASSGNSGLETAPKESKRPTAATSDSLKRKRNKGIVSSQNGRRLVDSSDTASASMTASSADAVDTESTDDVITKGKFMDLTYELSGYDLTNAYEHGLSPKFYISTESNELLVAGALCESGSSDCEMKILDGYYDLRVTGGLVEGGSLSWSYCGVKGSQASELHFKIDNNECTPLSQLNMVVKCVEGSSSGGRHHSTSANLEASDVHISGVLQIQGVHGSAPLSSDDIDSIQKAILEELDDAHLTSEQHSESQTKTSVKLLGHSHNHLETPARRRLELTEVVSNEDNRQMAFHVTVLAADIAVSELKSYLDRSMSSGLFVTRMKAMSRSQSRSVSLLSTVSRASLLELHIVHETIENRKMSVLASAFVGGCMMMGVFVAVLLVKSWRSSKPRYSHVSVEEVDLSLRSQINSSPTKVSV